VTDAVMAHRATLVRASMHSQRGAAAYDAAEIRATTAIVLPTSSRPHSHTRMISRSPIGRWAKSHTHS
jgi:hypothetical protein